MSRRFTNSIREILDDEADFLDFWLNFNIFRVKISPPAKAPAHSYAVAGGCGQASQSRVSKFFYTYVLRSLNDGKLYTGWTDNLKLRFNKHNEGKVNSTKARRPFELVYFEGCISKEKVILREKSLKTGFGRKYLKDRI